MFCGGPDRPFQLGCDTTQKGAFGPARGQAWPEPLAPKLLFQNMGGQCPEYDGNFLGTRLESFGTHLTHILHYDIYETSVLWTAVLGMNS